MNTKELECCAVHEISHLSDHKTPEDAMKDFCSDHSIYGGKMGNLGAFYIFTGVLKIKAGSTDYLSRNRNVDYGPAFAAFIKANKLGIVVGSPSRINRANHPDHTVKVWVWCPSIAGLNRWWGQNRPKDRSVW